MAKSGDTGRSKKPASSKDESAALKKKDSGSQKALKKPGSARKSARVPDEDGGDEKPKRRGSARTPGAAQAPRGGGQSEQYKKAFLYSTPIIVIFLLVVGIKLALMEEPKQTVIVDDPNKDIAGCRDKYNQAKTLYNTGHGIDGEAGTAKVKEAQKLLQEASGTIQEIRQKQADKRKAEGKEDTGKNDKGQAEYDAYEDLDQQIASLLVLVRKELQMR
jgi:hypothetical protein